MNCYPGSLTQGPEPASPGTEPAGVGTAAKNKPCAANTTPVAPALSNEHKDTRAAFWYVGNVSCFYETFQIGLHAFYW